MILVTRLAALALLASLASCLSGSNAVNLYGGLRNLDDDAFKKVDEPTYTALEGVLSFTDGTLVATALEGGIGHAEDDDDDVEVALDEYYAGLRFTFPLVPIVKPYASIGLTYLDGTFEDGNGGDFDDTGYAPYVRAGAAIKIALFQFGVDLRQTFESDLELGQADDVDGLTTSLFVGIAF